MSNDDTEDLKNKTDLNDQTEEKTEGKTKKITRLKNNDFFAKDILGRATKDLLITEISFRTRTGLAIYNMIYARVSPSGKEKASIDSYLYRPKELASLVMARDKTEQIEKLVDNRITELDKYVAKRHKLVSSLYEKATSIEEFQMDSGQIKTVQAKFSNSNSKRLIEIIKKIDDASYKAGYLEKIGQFTTKQEAELNALLYRRITTDARTMMTFIGRAVIAVRKELKSKST